MAAKRLMKELDEVRQNPDPLFTAGPVGDDDLFHWQATLVGPDSSPYEGGCFCLDIRFPAEYPSRPPEVRFATRIFHPNVDSNGAICVDILKSGLWRSECTIPLLLVSLMPMLCDPNPDYALNKVAGQLLRTDPPAFFDQARRETVEFASTGESGVAAAPALEASRASFLARCAQRTPGPQSARAADAARKRAEAAARGEKALAEQADARARGVDAELSAAVSASSLDGAASPAAG